MEQTTPNVWKQLLTAICLPHQYFKILAPKKGKLALLTTLILLVLTFLSSPFQLILTLGNHDKIQQILDSNIPEFEFKNGTLYMPDIYTYDDNSLYIYASSSLDSVSADDVLSLAEESTYDTIMIFTSNNCIIYSNNRLQSINYSDYATVTLTKSSLLSIANYFSAFIVILVIFILVGFAAGYLILSLLYSLCALILQNVLGLQQKLLFHHLFSLCLCAKLPIFILRRIIDIFDINFSINNIVGIAVTVLYIVLALLSIKRDFVPVQNWNQPQGYATYQGYPNQPQFMNQNYQNQPYQQTTSSQPYEPYQTDLPKPDSTDSNNDSVD